jgi:hypothetical protein
LVFQLHLPDQLQTVQVAFQLHHHHMAKPPNLAQQIQVAELRPVEASTHSLLQVVFLRSRHWEAVARVIKTFRMV